MARPWGRRRTRAARARARAQCRPGTSVLRSRPRRGACHVRRGSRAPQRARPCCARLQGTTAAPVPRLRLAHRVARGTTASRRRTPPTRALGPAQRQLVRTARRGPPRLLGSPARLATSVWLWRRPRSVVLPGLTAAVGALRLWRAPRGPTATLRASRPPPAAGSVRPAISAPQTPRHPPRSRAPRAGTRTRTARRRPCASAPARGDISAGRAPRRPQLLRARAGRLETRRGWARLHAAGPAPWATTVRRGRRSPRRRRCARRAFALACACA